MTRKLTAVLGALALATGLAACGDDDETTTLEAVTTTVTAPTTTSTTSSTTTDTTTSTSTDAAEDIPGNCDETEHADDPQCSGGVAAPDDDSSGPGG